MPPLVELRGVGVRRPNALILREVSLTIEPGEAVALFGANGSGKTTLLRVLATLTAPTSGDGAVLGRPLGTPAVEEVRPRIGLVGHEPALFESLTLGENLRLVARLGGSEDPAVTATAVLRAVGLEGAAGRLAADCSNGMRRRTDFARLLVTRPTLLLLDEAHVGLDAAAADLVELLVDTTLASGGAAVVVSHERERVAALTTRRLLLEGGTLAGAA
jgi:heme exporter protein A